MPPSRIPSGADILFAVVVPLTAIRGAVKLTQSDGDLAAHIRMGQVILDTGRLPSQSLASITAPTEPLVAHAWLSEILFTLLYSFGGLPLITAIAAIIIGLTHGSVAVFLRARSVDPRWALFAAVLSFALGSTHWLARPHMFSILAAALTLYLLESRSRRQFLPFALLFAIWANLHGGWLYGLALIFMYMAGSAIEAAVASDREPWLRDVRRYASLFGVALLATLLNPYGPRLHREVVEGATSISLARAMAEYQPPNFQDSGQWPFLLAILLTVVILALARERMRFSWLLVTVMSLFFALRSFRNIALFGVTAWPLIALHASSMRIFEWPRRFQFFPEFARIDPQTRVGWLAAVVAGLLLIVGLNRGSIAGREIIPDRFSNAAFPVRAVERARSVAPTDRVFDQWGWGGYMMLAWPAAQLHVDPLKFSAVTIDSYTKIEELRPGWKAELERWNIRTVIIRPTSRLAFSLAEDPGWAELYRDSTAVVYRPAEGAYP